MDICFRENSTLSLKLKSALTQCNSAVPPEIPAVALKITATPPASLSIAYNGAHRFPLLLFQGNRSQVNLGNTSHTGFSAYDHRSLLGAVIPYSLVLCVLLYNDSCLKRINNFRKNLTTTFQLKVYTFLYTMLAYHNFFKLSSIKNNLAIFQYVSLFYWFIHLA